MIETSSRLAETSLGEPLETRNFPVGDITHAVYDWVDLYYLPVGGRYGLDSSGPEIRAAVYSTSVAETVPTTGEYFALLALLLRGNKHVEERNWTAATSDFEQIRDMPFKMKELVSSAYLYKLSLGLGMIHFRAGSTEAALTNWNIATQLHPNKAVAYFYVGEALRTIGQFEKASENYRMALERDKGDPHLLHNLGVGFMKMGHYEESIPILKRAAGLKADADIYVNLGVAYDRSGMVEEKIEAFKKGLALNPDHPQAEEIRLNIETFSSGEPDTRGPR